MAVVDPQRRAALSCEPGAEFKHEAMARGVYFQEFAVRSIGSDIWLGLVRDIEHKPALAVHTHGALTPLTVYSDKLAHGQRVEKFVADHDRGSVWNFLQGLRPGDRHAGIDKQ